MTRRGVVGLFAGAAAMAMGAQPSLAAYGDAANVFGGKTGNFTGATQYEGDGYSVALPANWGPSKEKPFEGIDLRYVDSFDDVNNLEVIVQKSSKGSITDSSPSDFLNSIGSFWARPPPRWSPSPRAGSSPTRPPPPPC